MRTLMLIVLASAPAAADESPGRLAEALRKFESEDPAARDAASQRLRELLRKKLAPLLEAMKSEDPEIARRAREALESLLPPRPKPQTQQVSQAFGGGFVVVGNAGQAQQIVLRLVQGKNQLIRFQAAVQPPLKEFGLQGDRLVDGTVRKKLELPKKTGFLVTRVTPGSVARKLGVKRRDVIVSIDGKSVWKPESVEKALGADRKKWSRLRLKVARGGKLVDLPANRR